MNGTEAAGKLRRERRFLWNILGGFQPGDSGFRPAPDMMTPPQQVRHIEHTLRWFWEGAFGKGFDMNFEAHQKEIMAAEDWAAELAALDRTYEELAGRLEAMGEAELNAPLPPNPILGEAPRWSVIEANAEHTAHHRGALTVYLRLLGRVPVMAYS